METYLKNLLPRVRQFSQTLEKKELLVDQPWVLIDANGDKQQYIFERDGKLIMALNGKVQYGTWKYIPAAKSLLIDRANDSLLLNHDFVSAGVCILKKDGFVDEPWMLVNERVVPDLNVYRYLRSLLPQNQNIKQLPVSGVTIDYKNDNGTGPLAGSLVFGPDDTVVNGVFQATDGRHFFEIVDGVIVRVFEKILLKTDRGELIAEVNGFENLKKGNPVYYKDGGLAQGVYKAISGELNFNTLNVEGGRIKTIKRKVEPLVVVLLGMIVLIISALIYQFTTHRSL